MKPVGSPEITRPAVLPVEVMDAVEPIQTDKPSAVPLAHLRDDRIEAVARQPAADAEHAGLRASDGADDGFVLGGKHVRRGIEAHIVGAELDRHQRRVGGGHGAQKRDRPGRFGAAAGYEVEVHPQLVGNQRGKGSVRRRGETAGADAVTQGDVDLPLQPLGVCSSVHADHFTRCHDGTLDGRLPDGEKQ